MQAFSPEFMPLWTAIAAGAATLTALVTIAYTYFTLRLVRSQSEPKVIVYVKHDLERLTVLMLVVENIGRDIAHDVRFTASRPIPARAWGIEAPDVTQVKIMTDGPLVAGIPALGPNDSRTISWGQYGGLSAAIGAEPIRLHYSYRHGHRTFAGETQLEVESFAGTDASERPAVIVARSIKEIEGAMKSISNSLTTIAAKDSDAV